MIFCAGVPSLLKKGDNDCSDLCHDCRCEKWLGLTFRKMDINGSREGALVLLLPQVASLEAHNLVKTSSVAWAGAGAERNSILEPHGRESAEMDTRGRRFGGPCPVAGGLPQLRTPGIRPLLSRILHRPRCCKIRRKMVLNIPLVLIAVPVVTMDRCPAADSSAAQVQGLRGQRRVVSRYRWQSHLRQTVCPSPPCSASLFQCEGGSRARENLAGQKVWGHWLLLPSLS